MNDQEREELIVNYMPLANKIAWKKHRTTPTCVTIDELKSAAYMGLVDAASRFDPTRGIAFGVYARLRVAGEIGDYLRTLNWVGPISEMASLDAPAGDSGCLVDMLEKEEINDSPDEFFEKVTKPLTAIGRRLVKMYYVENKTLKEIGVLEGISESRASQILKQCRQQIGKRFDALTLYEELAA